MEFQVLVIGEFTLEHATDIAMGTEIDKIWEFEELAQGVADGANVIALLG
jgi:tartronate-semialdehyde synthase